VGGFKQLQLRKVVYQGRYSNVATSVAFASNDWSSVKIRNNARSGQDRFSGIAINNDYNMIYTLTQKDNGVMEIMIPTDLEWGTICLFRRNKYHRFCYGIKLKRYRCFRAIIG
jgi:hypothetical protein